MAHEANLIFELERGNGALTEAISRNAARWAELFHYNRNAPRQAGSAEAMNKLVRD